MDFVGLMYKFPVNRELTEREREDRLDPKKPARSQPRGQYSVIKMNSTYLECVDKFFAFKGFLTFVSIAGLSVLLPLLVVSIPDLFDAKLKDQAHPTLVLFFMVSTILFIVAGLIFIFFLLRQECFRYTHYPIRFNRKLRKVYVFRKNGTVLTANWDDIFFTLNMGKSSSEDFWDVRGHILAEDKKTVLETFALPHIDSREDKSVEDQTLTSFWEFARLYMEGGDKGLKRIKTRIGELMNVADKKESLPKALSQLAHKLGGGHLIGLLALPFALITTLPRWIAMLTCKIPQWPPEIEAECAIEPNDPYLVDETHPPPAA